MKIAYVTTYDSSNIHAWSGSGAAILKALSSGGNSIESIGNLRDKNSLALKLRKRLYGRLSSGVYQTNREPEVLKDYAAQVENALARISYDVVFSPGTIPIAYLKTEKPIVFWTDATFAGMIDFYPKFSNLCKRTIKNGNKMEQRALSNCRLALYTSEWAANTALQYYDVDPEKVKVVPFGANIDSERNLQDINSIIENKNFDTCKLLFIGVDWYRKGGDVALKVADLLNQRGIQTELHVVGDKPGTNIPAFVKQHEFVSKNTEEGRRYFDRLMTESHFLILPTRADCCPVVFAEASSFGLPSLAANVGGVATAIHDGKNGQTFSLDDSPEEYCNYIEKFMVSRQEYRELALSSFREYSERINWSTAGNKVHDLLREFCG